MNGDIARFAEPEVGGWHQLEVLLHLFMIGWSEDFAAAFEQFGFVLNEGGFEVFLSLLEPETSGAV